VLELTKPSAVPKRWLCVEGGAIDDVDFTGGAMLVSVANSLHGRNTRLLFADVSDHVREQLDRSGVTEVVGTDAYFEGPEQVRREFERGSTPDPAGNATDNHS
jgi:hypothetical protein